MSVLEDIEAIKQLKAEYCFALDDNRLEDLVSLFTDDAVCDFEPYFGIARGKEQIRALFREVEGDQPPGVPRTMHAVTNPWIRVTGDTAIGKWYLLDCLFYTKGEPRPLRILARYDEQYQRVNSEWKFKHEKIVFFHADVADIALGGMTPQR
ncbi:MAG TPA: nuclear transport factor 2 family protein [Candidatus Binataceae bacterium]|nr:nuclear transport factor 2 family protein [Candidatus Binataceae bacterium]